MAFNHIRSGIHSTLAEDYPHHLKKLWVKEQVEKQGHRQFIVWVRIKQAALHASPNTILVRNSLAAHPEQAFKHILKALARPADERPQGEITALIARRTKNEETWVRATKRRRSVVAPESEEVWEELPQLEFDPSIEQVDEET